MYRGPPKSRVQIIPTSHLPLSREGWGLWHRHVCQVLRCDCVSSSLESEEDTGCPPLTEHGQRVYTCHFHDKQEVPVKGGHPHSRGCWGSWSVAATSSTTGLCYIEDLIKTSEGVSSHRYLWLEKHFPMCMSSVAKGQTESPICHEIEDLIKTAETVSSQGINDWGNTFTCMSGNR